MLPVVAEIKLVQEAFTKTKTELAQENTFGVIGEGEATLVRNAVIFSMDVKPMQVGISPPHGNLNRVMEVGNAVVASQKQSPPNHPANAAQDDLEAAALYPRTRIPSDSGRPSAFGRVYLSQGAASWSGVCGG